MVDSLIHERDLPLSRIASFAFGHLTGRDSGPTATIAVRNQSSGVMAVASLSVHDGEDFQPKIDEPRARCSCVGLFDNLVGA